MEYREIDMNAYPRRAHFDYFRAMAYPYVGLTAEVDVTNTVRMAKESGSSFFLTLLYAAGNAANEVPSFRRRIRGDGIVEYARCLTSHTVMKPDGTYVYCTSDPSLPLPEFLDKTSRKQAEAISSGALREEVEVESLFFVSCLPWMSYTALVQPVPRPADSNPRITWGKYFDRGDRKILPLSVLVNHALVDGKQIADFYDRFRERT